MTGAQAMRFGASPAACRQAMDLGFACSSKRLSPAAQQDLACIQHSAEEHMQKVSCW